MRHEILRLNALQEALGQGRLELELRVTLRQSKNSVRLQSHEDKPPTHLTNLERAETSPNDGTAHCSSECMLLISSNIDYLYRIVIPSFCPETSTETSWLASLGSYAD